MKTKIIPFFLFVFAISWGQYGPQNIAKSNRNLWVLPMESSKDFDVASKCEMLVFIEVFTKYSSYNEEKIKKLTKLKSVNTTSIEHWKKETQKLLVENINALEKEALNDVVKIPTKATWENISTLKLEAKIPEKLANWYTNSKAFYENYIYEQIRLAALNPKITSEIATLNSNEITGKEFEQKHFLLTFDDGPTSKKGNTDKTLKMLAKNNLSGIFYVLGNAFQNRKKTSSIQELKDLYKNQTVASHGKEHLSHQKLITWKTSIDFTSNQIESVFEKTNISFRPPYGQRTKEIASYLEKKNEKIVLWNLDSQDWNQKITAQEVADRQITLMLLWRKGILLFHDVHPKALIAIPKIYDYFKNCHINWVDSNYLNKL